MGSEHGGGGGGVDYGLNPQPVYQAGRSIADLEGDASAATTKFTTALTDGAGAVHHSALTTALQNYSSTWSGPASRFPNEVAAVGNGVSNVGSEGAASDAQSLLDLTPAQSAAGNNSSLLTRPIAAQ